MFKLTKNKGGEEETASIKKPAKKQVVRYIKDFDEGFARGANHPEAVNATNKVTATGAAKYRSGSLTKTIGGKAPGNNSEKGSFKIKKKGHNFKQNY